MTGIEVPPASVAIAKVVVTKVGPTTFSYFKTLVKGRKVLVVGPSGAGKTVFLDYFHYGIFAPPQPHHRTYDPLTNRRFVLSIGNNRNLTVPIASTVDVPGQYGATLADEVVKHRPHGLIIMLDATSRLSGANENQASAVWLTEFCKRLDHNWAQRRPRKNRLKYVVVALNKRDLVGTDQALETYRLAIEDVVEEYGRGAFGPRLPSVRVMPCVSVESPYGKTLIDSILIDLGKTLDRT